MLRLRRAGPADPGLDHGVDGVLSCSTTPTAANVATTVGDGIAGSAYWTSWNFGDTSTSLSQPVSMDEHALTTGETDTVTAYTYNNGNSTSGQVNTITGTSTQGPGGTTTAAYTYNPLGQTITRPNAAGKTETLAWNTQNELADLSTCMAAGNATYLYDAARQHRGTGDPEQHHPVPARPGRHRERRHRVLRSLLRPARRKRGRAQRIRVRLRPAEPAGHR